MSNQLEQAKSFKKINLTRVEEVDLVQKLICSDIISYYEKNQSIANKTRTHQNRYLSAKTKISESMIRDFLYGKRMFSVENIYKIYSCILDSKDITRIHLSIDNTIVEYLEKNMVYNKEHLQKTIASNEVQNQFIFKNDMTTTLYLLTAGKGCHVNYIREQYGNNGLTELRYLEDKNIVIIENNVARRGSLVVYMNTEAINRLSTNAIENFSKQKSVYETYHRSIKYGQVSRDALLKLHTASEKYLEEVNEIIKADNIDNSKEQTEKYIVINQLISIE